MSEVLVGKCPICGKDAVLHRTYFYYNIPCECCDCKIDGTDMHFEITEHCKNCIPDIPYSITPLLKSKIDGKEYRIEIKGILPYEIHGEFCINHDCTVNHLKNYNNYK